MTLTDAVAAFLGPLMAEYARLIEEGDPRESVVILFNGYRYQTTLGAIQQLDAAYLDARERADKAACRRRDRKAAGRLL